MQPVNPRSSKIWPYFPRYMFAHVDLDEVGLSALSWVPGAIGIVQFDGRDAAPVSDGVITDESGGWCASKRPAVSSSTG